MSSREEIWRVFCAIEFPKQVVESALERISVLRARFPDVTASWIREGNFHLTIEFIGEVPRAKVDRLSGAALRAATNLQTFAISVSGAGSFPKSGPPKVLWLGVEDQSGKLNELHRRLEEECAVEGFAKEDRAFHPHLTIARVRRIAGARELAAAHRELGFSTIEVAVKELLVIRSELSSSGSKYSVVSRHSLRSVI
ncbi:MAG TPA: RNA 2',3'-cyclic phosphodiesterase [Pyrinomonadaceae bacterium]|nr:RNA 2',3'-cyclic phosphodiesterase [Pyrinomonadaceae bacterium]